MPGRTSISVGNLNLIKKLYVKDLLYATQIARMLGLTPTVVNRVLRETNVELRGSYKPLAIGTEFGRLRVTKAAPPMRRKDGWNCSRVWVHCNCNGPNSDFIVRSSDLRKSKNGLRSCGCDWNRSPNYRPNPMREWKRVLKAYRRKDPLFALHIRQLKHICSLPCHYCGAPPGNQLRGRGKTPRQKGVDRRSNVSNGKVVLQYSGIDEVVKGIGHVAGNVLPSCIVCNRAKSDSELEPWCCYIHRDSAIILDEAGLLGEQLREVPDATR